MKIYWSLNSVPELAELPRSERDATFADAVRNYRSRLTVAERVGQFAGICVAGGVAAAVCAVVTSSGVWSAGLGGAFGAAVGNHMRLPQARAELRARHVG